MNVYVSSKLSTTKIESILRLKLLKYNINYISKILHRDCGTLVPTL